MICPVKSIHNTAKFTKKIIIPRPYIAHANIGDLPVNVEEQILERLKDLRARKWLPRFLGNLIYRLTID